MKLVDVKKKAKEMGLEFSSKISKKELIWKIQAAENYPQCYGTNDGTCPYTDCAWLDDCGQ